MKTFEALEIIAKAEDLLNKLKTVDGFWQSEEFNQAEGDLADRFNEVIEDVNITDEYAEFCLKATDEERLNEMIKILNNAIDNE